MKIRDECFCETGRRALAHHRVILSTALLLLSLATCAASQATETDPKRAFEAHRKAFDQIAQQFCKNKRLEHLLVYPEDVAKDDSKPDPYATQGISPATLAQCRRLIKEVGLSYIEATKGEADFVFATTTPGGQTWAISGATVRYVAPSNPDAEEYARQATGKSYIDVSGGKHKTSALGANWYMQFDDMKI